MLFIDGEKADLSHEKYPNINVITGALKLYLRLLPIPLITFIVHPKLLEAMRKLCNNNLLLLFFLLCVSSLTEFNSNDGKIPLIKNALQLLPKPHYDTLKYTIEHLYRYHNLLLNRFL